MPKEALTCDGCKGKCCTYVCVELDDPKSPSDFEDMIYYLHHKGVKIAVTLDEDDEPETWYLEFAGRCRYLNVDGWCTVYDRRPQICRDHIPEVCEHHDPDSFRDITTVPELFAFMREIGRERCVDGLAAKVPEFLR